MFSFQNDSSDGSCLLLLTWGLSTTTKHLQYQVFERTDYSKSSSVSEASVLLCMYVCMYLSLYFWRSLNLRLEKFCRVRPGWRQVVYNCRAKKSVRLYSVQCCTNKLMGTSSVVMCTDTVQPNCFHCGSSFSSQAGVEPVVPGRGQLAPCPSTWWKRALHSSP